MSDAGLLTGSVGNLSLRRGDRVTITPTRLPYAAMHRRDLVTVDLDWRGSRGNRRPSRELPLHLAVYRARADASAVVHCHSVWATAWSWLGERIRPDTEEIEYYGIGEVRTAEAADAGSERLAENAVRALGGSSAALLAGHGIVAVGADLPAAVTIARAVEQQAQVAWLLRIGAPMRGQIDAATVPSSAAGAEARREERTQK
jgi:L-ribulose-5-phosphate 4-epimerase